MLGLWSIVGGHWMLVVCRWLVMVDCYSFLVVLVVVSCWLAVGCWWLFLIVGRWCWVFGC